MVDTISFFSKSVTEKRGLVNPASEIQAKTSSSIRISLRALLEQAVFNCKIYFTE